MIQFILFDYGATLDTGGTHWYHIFAREHRVFHAALSDALLREAYVFAERTVSSRHDIAAGDDFLDTLRAKVALQGQYLAAHGAYPPPDAHAEEIAQACYATARRHTQQAATVLRCLQAEGYTLGLVSNFYGNLHAVLADFALLSYFSDITESAQEHRSKPDPLLWQAALDHLHAAAADTLVVGDSYPKDIVPAHHLGCRTAWLQGQGWNPAPMKTPEADYVLTALDELLPLMEPLRVVLPPLPLPQPARY